MQTPQILIVEDETITRNTLKSIFEAEGYDEAKETLSKTEVIGNIYENKELLEV